MKLKFSFTKEELTNFLWFLKRLFDLGSFENVIMSIEPSGEHTIFYVTYIEEIVKKPKVITGPINYLSSYWMKSENIIINKEHEDNALKDHVSLAVILAELKKFITHIELALSSGILKDDERCTFRYCNYDNIKSLEFQNLNYKIYLPCTCYKDDYVYSIPRNIEHDDFLVRVQLKINDFKSGFQCAFGLDNNEEEIRVSFKITNFKGKEYRKLIFKCNECVVTHLMEYPVEVGQLVNLEDIVMTFRYEMLQTIINFAAKQDAQECKLILFDDKELCFIFSRVNEDDDQEICRYSLLFPVHI
jgi:hypothetical protein